MMKTFEFQILRYQHDLVTEEFVNIGVVVFQPDDKFLSAEVLSTYSRISHFFSEANGIDLLRSLKQFKSNINHISKQLGHLYQEHSNIESITSSILHIDNSSLYLTKPSKRLDINGDAAIDDLFNRFVTKYVDNYSIPHDDKYVWKRVYKKYFDKYDVTKQLGNHSVTTSNDIIEFDKAWKNGIWNCYQTLSFDLKREEAIKNKVYKWSGILGELETTRESINLYLLTTNPKKKHLRKFISDKLSLNPTKNLKVNIVAEKDADNFAKQVKEELAEANK